MSKFLMIKCPTCDGEGIVKKDELGEVHHINTNEVFDYESGEYLKLKECICPECDGLGEVDMTEDFLDNQIDEFIKKRKEL